jgi:hypothetical protein
MARTIGDGGWSWFGDPRAVHFAGRRRKTYVGWVDRRGAVIVASFDHRSRHVERAVLKRGLSVDDHNSPGLLIGPDAHLTVFYTGPHRASMHWRRSAQPEDVSSWEPEQTLPTNTRGDKGYTYPNPIRLAEEQATYLFWRGGQWWPAFSRCPDGGAWTAARTILRIPGQRPYLKLHSDHRRDIHIAYTEGNPGSFVNDVHYLRFHDGAFHRADGSRVARIADLPLSPSAGEVVYDAGSHGGVRAWVWDVAARRDGRPVIVYVVLPETGSPVYERAEYSGGRWLRHRIVDAGGWRIGNYAPGVSLDHDDPDAVVLSRQEGGRCVVQRWVTADRGATWRHRTINDGGAGDCLRPIIPRGRPTERDVIWMQGDYRAFTDYRTDVRTHLSRS